MVEDRTAVILLRDLFVMFKDLNVKYCVIGDAREFEEKILGDVDFIINTNNLNRLIIDFSEKNKISIAQMVKHRNGVCYTLRWVCAKGGVETLSIDFSESLTFDGVEYVSQDDVFSKIGESHLDDGTGYMSLSVDYEFYCYLIKKVYKEKLTRKNMHYLKYLVIDSVFSDIGLQTNVFESDRLGQFIDALKSSSDLDIMRSFKKVVFEKKNAGVASKVRVICKELVRLTIRALNPSGLVVVVLGPDGSGKSTIIEGVSKSWGLIYRDVVRFHLRPYLTAGKSDYKAVNEPHNQKSRGLMGSIAKLIYFVIVYNVGYIIKVLPRKITSKLVVFDRYFHDLIVDPLRYRQAEPRWISVLISKFIPKPDVWILLDAPPEVIHARKKEVTLEETGRQRNEYLKLFSSLDNAFVIDANQNVENVIGNVNSVILQAAVTKTKKRIGIV